MKTLQGHLLAAAPGLLDPNFRKTVLLMLAHSADGAVGVVLNRPTEATVEKLSEEVFSEAIDWDKPIHLGGPVPGPLMILHAEEEFSDQEILPGVYSTVDSEKIQDLLKRRVEPCLVIANYAGWGPGQLESEMDEGSWLTLPACVEHVFEPDGDGEDFWESVRGQFQTVRLTDLLGVREQPSDPSLN